MIDGHVRNAVVYRGGSFGPVLRWTSAAALVIAAHGAAIWIALHWKPAEAAAGDPPAAIMVELAPLAVAPETPVHNLAPGPQMVEAQPEPELVPVPEPEIKLPELPQQENAEAVLAPPPEPPQEQKPPPKKRETERKKPVERDKPKASQTTAPMPSARQSDRASAPALGASASSSFALASWRSELMGHLNRHKRFPPGASGSGTASVTFSISRSGQVLSARLSRSSGDSALDQEAVAMVQRASPVPAPPSDMGGGGSIPLNVPVRFQPVVLMGRCECADDTHHFHHDAVHEFAGAPGLGGFPQVFTPFDAINRNRRQPGKSG